MRQILLIAFMTSLLVLMACGEGELNEPPLVQPLTSNSSNPVKTMTTPWGTRELYNPVKNPKFLQAVHKIYERGDITFGDLKIHGFEGRRDKPVVPDIVNNVRSSLLAQRYDMARIGCSRARYFSYSDFPNEGLRRACRDSQLGSPDLSVCEKSRWTALYGSREQVRLPVKTSERSRYRLADAIVSPHPSEAETIIAGFPSWTHNVEKKPVYEISYIGEQSGLSINETVKLLTDINCQRWKMSYWPNWFDDWYNNPKTEDYSFATAGKPTKTINTPEGPREIYDPVQDEEIRLAFKAVYDKQYEKAEYWNSVKRGKIGDKNLNLIFLSKEIHSADFMRLGCKNLRAFECATIYERRPNPLEQCGYLENLGKAITPCEADSFLASHYLKLREKKSCSLKGKTYDNPIKVPIGYSKNLTWENELEDFFAYECKAWIP